MLRDKLIELRNRYVPYRRGKYGKEGKFAINKELQQDIKEKRRLHLKWIRSIGTNNKERTRANYVRARNLVNKNVTKTKRNLEKEICSQAKRSPKRFWKHIRNSMKTKSGISPLL